MAITLLVLGFIVSLFIITHLRPLDENEMENLSSMRRKKAIDQYFMFDNFEYNVDKNFKKRMNPNGKFYGIDEELFHFPSIASALLKYKKHEWIIIAFEKNKNISICWLNKGFDRSGVSPYLSVEDMIELANRESFSSVLIFHNHPNSNPNQFDCSMPSKQDISSANEFGLKLNNGGINLLELICERGIHFKYFKKYSDKFLPNSEFLEVVKNQNGISKFANFSLHFERYFLL